MENTVIYEGISFNKAWVASKTFKQFCAHESHHGLSTAQMQEVYNICREKPVKEKPGSADENEKTVSD